MSTQKANTAAAQQATIVGQPTKEWVQYTWLDQVNTDTLTAVGAV